MREDEAGGRDAEEATLGKSAGLYLSHPSSRWIRVIIIFFGLLLTSQASAEYVLRPGDEVEISAVGLPELRQRTAINLDGEASFPLLGQIKVAGMLLSQLRAKVVELLATKLLRRSTGDGHEVPVIITPETINVTISKYRPVYVDGDVAKPGAENYAPGLTVRQVIALAGGYDVMRFRGHDPFLEAADLRAEYYSLWTEFAKEQARISRVKAELAGKTVSDRQGLVETPIPRSVVSQIEDLQSELLVSRNDDHRKEIEHYRNAIQQEEHRITVLREAEQKENEGAQADANDLLEAQQNFNRRLVPKFSMIDTRRLAFLSATQALQTTAALAQEERAREDLSRLLDKAVGQRRIDLLNELNEANVKIQAIRSKLQSVGDKIIYTGLLRSQLVRGTGKPEISIFRDAGANRITLAADQDTELTPGDVVEVSVRIDAMPNSGVDSDRIPAQSESEHSALPQ
jgi:polysaccharide export outer membrane protein